MRDMDTIEEAEANSWSASETAAAWYDTNDDGKADTKDAPSSFTFNRLRVGLAGEDKLLIVAEGTLMALEAVQQMRAAYDSSGGLTGLTPVTDEEGEPVYSFQPRQTNGAYDTTNGVYALSFGMGNQGIHPDTYSVGKVLRCCRFEFSLSFYLLLLIDVDLFQ